jgi:hypothetical protein
MKIEKQLVIKVGIFYDYKLDSIVGVQICDMSTWAGLKEKLDF